MPASASVRVLPSTVFHLVDRRNWESVSRNGLRSAARLAQDCLPKEQANEVLRNWRPRETPLPGGVLLRDQGPMSAAALAPCLRDGITPEDWYELVNLGVYFWADPERFRRHLAAQNGPQVVMEVDGPALAAAYEAVAFVTAFNVGSARRRPAPRGPGTFVPYRAWLASGWNKEDPAPSGGRRASHPPAELVIRAEITDPMRFVRTLREAARPR